MASFILPPFQNEGAASEEAIMTRNFANLKVLVAVSDDPAQARLREQLREIGISIHETAVNKREAMRKLENWRADIILAEAATPVDCIGLAQRLRCAENVYRYTPIIMVTAKPNMMLVRRAISAGINEILVTPVQLDTLSYRIAFVVHRPRNVVSAGNYTGPNRRRLKMAVKHRRRTEDWEAMAYRHEMLGAFGG